MFRNVNYISYLGTIDQLIEMGFTYKNNVIPALNSWDCDGVNVWEKDMSVSSIYCGNYLPNILHFLKHNEVTGSNRYMYNFYVDRVTKLVYQNSSFHNDPGYTNLMIPVATVEILYHLSHNNLITIV